jgi:hypothetical protein
VVCFLGVAGIGKSTLINALVDGRRSTFPHGGIGPLTAQALSVRRGSPPGFEVKYHPPGQLWKLAMALEWGFKDQLRAQPSGQEPTIPVEPPENEPLDQEPCAGRRGSTRSRGRWATHPERIPLAHRPDRVSRRDESGLIVVDLPGEPTPCSAGTATRVRIPRGARWQSSHPPTRGARSRSSA